MANKKRTLPKSAATGKIVKRSAVKSNPKQNYLHAIKGVKKKKK